MKAVLFETDDPDRAIVVLPPLLDRVWNDPRVVQTASDLLDADVATAGARPVVPGAIPISPLFYALLTENGPPWTTLETLVATLNLSCYPWFVRVLALCLLAVMFETELRIEEPPVGFEQTPGETAENYAARMAAARRVLWRPEARARARRGVRPSRADWPRDVDWFYRATIQDPRVGIGTLGHEYEATVGRATPAASVPAAGIARVRAVLDGLTPVSQVAPLRPRTGRVHFYVVDPTK